MGVGCMLGVRLKCQPGLVLVSEAEILYGLCFGRFSCHPHTHKKAVGAVHARLASTGAYNAAKHGVAGFTKTVALELARKNVSALGQGCRGLP